MKYYYPAVFACHEEEGVYTITFPDLAGSKATGDTIEIAVRKAREVMGMALLDLEEKGIPAPFPTSEVLLQKKERGCHVCMMMVDMDEYRAYRAYKVEEAARENAAWADKRKKHRSSLFRRVFGLH